MLLNWRYTPRSKGQRSTNISLGKCPWLWSGAVNATYTKRDFEQWRSLNLVRNVNHGRWRFNRSNAHASTRLRIVCVCVCVCV